MWPKWKRRRARFSKLSQTMSQKINKYTWDINIRELMWRFLDFYSMAAAFRVLCLRSRHTLNSKTCQTNDLLQPVNRIRRKTKDNGITIKFFAWQLLTFVQLWLEKSRLLRSITASNRIASHSIYLSSRILLYRILFGIIIVSFVILIQPSRHFRWIFYGRIS